MATKKVHLASKHGGRSRCRYTSRPNVKAIWLPLAEFLAQPTDQQCIECSKKAKELAETAGN